MSDRPDAPEQQADPHVLLGRIIDAATDLAHVATRYNAKTDPLDTAMPSDIPDFVMPNEQWLARWFHATYERLAPRFGYQTRAETHEFDPDSPNGKLMLAVCKALKEEIEESPRPKIEAQTNLGDLLGRGLKKLREEDDQRASAQMGERATLAAATSAETSSAAEAHHPEQAESATPRTDAWYEEHRHTLDTPGDAVFAREFGDFARTLEREIADLLEKLSGEVESNVALRIENADLRRELAGVVKAHEIANSSADDQMRQKREAERQRDEAREAIKDALSGWRTTATFTGLGGIEALSILRTHYLREGFGVQESREKAAAALRACAVSATPASEPKWFKKLSTQYGSRQMAALRGDSQLVKTCDFWIAQIVVEHWLEIRALLAAAQPAAQGGELMPELATDGVPIPIRPKGIVPLNSHPVLMDAYNVIQAIEACGGSIPLTNAVTKAGDLLSKLQAMFERGELLAAAPQQGLEPRGCPTPGACSCPGAPLVEAEATWVRVEERLPTDEEAVGGHVLCLTKNCDLLYALSPEELRTQVHFAKSACNWGYWMKPLDAPSMKEQQPHNDDKEK